jgi:hypothetical protein
MSVDCNEFWDTPFLLESVDVVLGLVVRRGGRDLLVAEKSEFASSPVSGGEGEAGIFCAGEDMPVSQLPG